MILLIDDDPEFQHAAQQIPVFQPVVAANGITQATKLMSNLRNEMTLALVDLDLAGESGFQAIENLKRTEPLLPIIAISGVCSSDVLASARFVGADDVLAKPITSEWSAMVQRLQCTHHKTGTGHFRCRCGARLIFGSGSAAFQQIAEAQRVGNTKRGRCPNCGILHSVQY
jgi:CheY-like chemotaxis protein